MKSGTTKGGRLEHSSYQKKPLSGTVSGLPLAASHLASAATPSPNLIHSGVKFYRPKDYYKVWYLARKGVEEKLINLKYIKMFGDAIDGHVDPTELDWEEKVRKYRYTGGYANFHLMRFSMGIYIDFFPTWGLYKEAPADEAMLEYFLQQSNDRYGQQPGIFEKERPYTLFLLQMVAGKDYYETLKYINWATKSKTYTLFKTHPCPGGNTHFDGFWRRAEQLGITSEYTVLVDGFRSEEMIKEADRVVSVDSGGTFKAILYDKPVCTLRGPSMTTDIVPLVKTNDEILDVKAVATEDKLKWLNWFYHKVGIDFHKEDYKERLLHKLARYKEGESDYDLHRW